MRILHVITSLQTGGAETLVVNMLPRFVKLGHVVGLVVFNGERTPLTERLERECPECELYALGSGYYNPWYILKLIGVMRQYDIVHTHNSSPQLFAAIANMFCKKRLITTEHNTYNRKRNNRLLSVIDKWMYKRYHNIICISDQAETNLRVYLNVNTNVNINENANKNDNYSLTPKSIITTIYNGVDVAGIHNAKPIVSMRNDRFVAVMVAAFRPQKDQDTLIKAMSLLHKEKYELWIVGNGERRADLQLLIDNLELNNRVKLLGLRTDVPRILKTADVVVMSSHWEGLSLSNIEGMSAGKPFVASDVDGLHEVTDGFGVLFPHGDADALATIIKRLHDDKSYYKEVANACYQRAKQFDIKTMVAGYAAVYDKLSNG